MDIEFDPSDFNEGMKTKKSNKQDIKIERDNSSIEIDLDSLANINRDSLSPEDKAIFDSYQDYYEKEHASIREKLPHDNAVKNQRFADIDRMGIQERLEHNKKREKEAQDIFNNPKVKEIMEREGFSPDPPNVQQKKMKEQSNDFTDYNEPLIEHENIPEYIPEINEKYKETKTYYGNTSKYYKVNNLPSGFIAYPKGAEVYYTPMAYGEVTQFSQLSKSMIKSPKELIRLSLPAIKTSFNKKYLTFYDYLYIGHLRRLATFDDTKATITSTCPSCGKEVNTVIDFFNLPFRTINIPKLPIRINIGGEELVFTLPTVGDIMDLEENFVFGVGLLAKCVRNKEYKEALRILANAKGKDFELIDYIEKLMYHGLEPIPVKCDNILNILDVYLEDIPAEPVKCGYEYVVEAEDPFVFITPFRQSEESVRSKIIFG